MRGRLIQSFVAHIAPLDVAATRAAGNYDDDFRETVRVADTSQRGSKDGRVEGAVVQLECQVEDVEFEKRQAMFGGDSPRTALTLILFQPDLEDAGLLNAQGVPTVPKAGDRLVALYDVWGALVQDFNAYPLYATHVQPRAYALGQQRNLILVEFVDRETSTNTK